MKAGFLESEKRMYSEGGFWKDTNIPTYFDDCFELFGSRTAFIDGDVIISYAEVAKKIDSLVSGLKFMELNPGDIVLMQMKNSADFFIVFFALLKVRAIPILTLPTHSVREISALIAKTRAIAYFGEAVKGEFDYEQLAATVAQENKCLKFIVLNGATNAGINLINLYRDFFSAQSCDSEFDDVAFFLLSGGTTNLPKLIPRTHTDYIYNFETMSNINSISCDSVYLAALPVAHNFTLGCPGVLGCLARGGSVVIAKRPDLLHLAQLISKHAVTTTALVPTLVEVLLQACELDLINVDSLQLIQVGGAMFSPASASRVRSEMSCNLQQVYGMSEGLLCATRLDDELGVIFNTQGRPISSADQIKVVDNEGRRTAVGESGELCVRGPYTIKAYFAEIAQNILSFDEDGFYRTGDSVKIDGTGNLVVLGRIKEQINRGGEKYSPKDVEDSLFGNPAIESCALISVCDDVLGERVFLFVVLHDKLTDSEKIIQILKEKGLPRFKLPDHIIFLPCLPTTKMGKVDKKELVAIASEYKIKVTI